MPYTDYNQISYILSEKPGLAGRIAYIVIDNIIEPNDIIKFTFYGHGKSDEKLNSLIKLHNDVTILPSKNNEKEFVVKNLVINDKLMETLCLLGTFPNYLIISKIGPALEKNNGYFWSVEFSDEILTFSYMKSCVDASKVTLIEQSILSNELSYERKRIKHKRSH